MTAEKMRQSDFAEKHKLTPGEVKILRETHLVEGTDFWSEGRAIFWTVEAVEKVESGIAQKSPPAVIPTGEDAAHEVAAALSAARQKNMASLVTADQQSAPLPEAEEETALPPVETPENFSAFVTKPCRNKRFVYADFNGEKVAVSCHPRHQLKIVRKNIRVRVEKEGDTTRYIHVP